MGCGRVFTADQKLAGRPDALQTAGGGEVFVDEANGKLGWGLQVDTALLVARDSGQWRRLRPSTMGPPGQWRPRGPRPH